MWWGSLIQSVTAELYLTLRKSQFFHSSKFNKRLDIHESSTGENAAFVDSWVRTPSGDFEAVLNWSQKAGRDGVLILDLWHDFAYGFDLSARAEVLAEIALNAGLVVVLLPRICFGGWCEVLAEAGVQGLSPERMRQLSAHMHIAKSNFEFLLNSDLPLALLESSITRKDFEHALGLHFQQSRKFGGLVHLIPREIASAGSMGFTDVQALARSITEILEDRYLGSDTVRWKRLVHQELAPAATDFVLGSGGKNGSSVGGTGSGRRRFLSRRYDGALALSTGWPLFLRTTRGDSAAALKTSLVQDEGARQFLIFLANYEARLIAESRMGAIQKAYPSRGV